MEVNKMVNEIDPKIIAKAKEQLTKAIVNVMQGKHTSWVARKFLSRAPIFTTDVPTACTDGTDIYINPIFWTQQTNKQRVFLLVHEGMHMLLIHCNSHFQKKLHQYIYNVSADTVINAILLMNDIGEPIHNGINPFNGRFEYIINGVKLKFDDCEKKSANDIYKIIMKHVKENPGSGQGGEGEGDGPPVDIRDGKGEQHNPHGPMKLKPFTPQEVSDREGEIRKVLNEAKMRGNMPGPLRDMLAKMVEPQIDWRQETREEVYPLINTKPNWSKIRKRRVGCDFIFPGWTKEGLRAIWCMDTSGSVDDYMLNAYRAEGKALNDAYPAMQLVAMMHHSEVYYMQEMDDTDGIDFKKMKTGGTSHLDVFAKAEELEIDLLICLTDGFSEFPKTTTIPHVLWIVTDKDGMKHIPDNIGRKILVDLDKERERR
jgi:predicted metal-dependent peptidase